LASTARYFPLPYNRSTSSPSNAPVFNIPRNETITHHPVYNHTVTTTTMHVSGQPNYLLADILITAIMVIIIVVLIETYYRYTPPRSTQVWVRTWRKSGEEESLPITYDYSGVKAVLRKYYVILRGRLGCRNCTPRELAEKAGVGLISAFARIYEEVVYGNRLLKNISRVLKSIERWLLNE
jgi:hypothetical protein